MAGIIIPKTNVDDLKGPLIFLEGPVLTAPKWHYTAAEIAFSIDSNSIIVMPVRYVEPGFEKYIINGNESFPRQRAFEIHYIEKAGFEKGVNGCVAMYLPSQEDQTTTKVYGATTRVEFGEIVMRKNFDPTVRFCIGTEGNFPEWKTMQYDLNFYLPDLKVQPTLEDTIKEALRIANDSN